MARNYNCLTLSGLFLLLVLDWSLGSRDDVRANRLTLDRWLQKVKDSRHPRPQQQVPYHINPADVLRSVYGRNISVVRAQGPPPPSVTKSGSVAAAVNFHHPERPKFKTLLRHIKPIIPSFFPEPPKDPNVQLLENIMDVSLELKNEIASSSKVPEDQIKGEVALVDDLINLIKALLAWPKMINTRTVNLVVERFKNLIQEPAKISPKAPFGRLGEDCFDDVDHKILAMEIKRLALDTASYLRERMWENVAGGKEKTNLPTDLETRVKFRTDAVLTETTALIAKLHRSILRNWHHVMMVVGNLAKDQRFVASSDQASDVPEPVDDAPEDVEDDNVLVTDMLTLTEPTDSEELTVASAEVPPLQEAQ